MTGQREKTPSTEQRIPQYPPRKVAEISDNDPFLSWGDVQPKQVLRHRRSRSDVAANRVVAVSLRPHLEKIDRWITRLVQLNAVLLTHSQTSADRAEAIEQLRELSSEAETTFECFKADMAHQPPHGRIEDVTRSFERLLSMLNRQGAP